jgi:hypothetical protein
LIEEGRMAPRKRLVALVALVLLATLLLVAPVNASGPGPCPPQFELEEMASPMDRNGDGWVCVKPMTMEKKMFLPLTVIDNR